MQTYTVPSLAEPVGTLWRDFQAEYTESAGFSVAAPLSNTPLPLYGWIARRAAAFPRWEQVRFVLMDEMLDGRPPPFRYVPIDDPASFEGFARRNFLAPLRDGTGAWLDVIKPPLDDIGSFSTPINLLILALGVGGNYANVMPGCGAHVGWHVSHLTPEYRAVHTGQGSQSYAGATYGMSLGPQQVLAADHVVVIISGAQKRDLARRLLAADHFAEDFPLSIIHHPGVREHVTVFITHDAVGDSEHRSGTAL